MLVLGGAATAFTATGFLFRSVSFQQSQQPGALCRMAFAAVQQLEPLAKGVISVAAAALTKMKANCADAPYVFEKGPGGLRLIVHAGGGMTSNSAQYHFATGRRTGTRFRRSEALR
jgi:hypothetical protein